jgi:nicotinate dehydrogenase subunit B
MQFARVVRPSGRNATFAGWGSAYSTALGFPGIVGIYQTGNFVYVLSSDEGTAAQVVTDFGANIAQWNDGPALTTLSSLQADPSTNPLMNTLADGGLVYVEGDQVDVGDAPGAFGGAPPNDQLTATYFTPFYMHGSMGGSAAVASWDGSIMTVYSGTQGPGPLQAAITALLEAFDSNFAGSVHIIYTEQPGCYGHDGADDCSAEAALIAYQQGGAIKVQWSRADENQWEPLSPATAHQMQGAIGQGTISDSQVISWQHDVYSPPHNSRPGAGAAAGNLLVTQYIGGTPAPMPPLNVNLATRNAPVNYAFPNSRVGRHFVTSFQLSPGTMSAASPLSGCFRAPRLSAASEGCPTPLRTSASWTSSPSSPALRIRSRGGCSISPSRVPWRCSRRSARCPRQSSPNPLPVIRPVAVSASSPTRTT